MKHRDEILRLRSEGKTYGEIMELLGCSKGTISYHCANGLKEKRRIKLSNKKQENPIHDKIRAFCDPKKIAKKRKLGSTKTKRMIFDKIRDFTEYKMNFTVEQVIEKLGPNPKCYLTGTPIEINQPRTYEFDHIIPRVQGGQNTLDNLGVCIKDANRSKCYLNYEEYLELCLKVVQNAGYNISK